MELTLSEAHAHGVGSVDHMVPSVRHSDCPMAVERTGSTTIWKLTKNQNHPLASFPVPSRKDSLLIRASQPTATSRLGIVTASPLTFMYDRIR